jgi:exopolysaccharide biosynthesis polyprenyl glycosylphosphotransferase
MTKKSHLAEAYVPIMTIISDALAIELSFILAYLLRFKSPLEHYIPANNGIPPIDWYLILSVIVIPIWILVFQSRKMYRPRRVIFVFDEFFIIVRLVSFCIFFSFGLVFFYRTFPYSRLTFIITWFFSIILITLGRYITLKIEKTFYSKGIGLKNAVVAGTNENALDICRTFSNSPYTGYKIIGLLSDKENIKTEFNGDVKLLGSYYEIRNIVNDYDIESVLVSLPSGQHEKLYEMMKLCEGEIIEFLIVPDFLEIITSSVKLQEIEGIPLLRIKGIPMNIWNRFVKRTFDFVFALLILLITSPLLITLAVLIKLTSKGPVFYKQERLSMTGKKFDMIKFRSMVQDAERDTGAVFASKNDNRITSIGSFLRKYSLDELPQFFNVLKGEMSIVGPRPEREYFINLMKDKIPKYLERHRMKCGITGWAQVNGYRGTDTPLEKRIEHDIYYIENWSLIFDLKIILKTLREMFFSKTAF